MENDQAQTWPPGPVTASLLPPSIPLPGDSIRGKLSLSFRKIVVPLVFYKPQMCPLTIQLRLAA